MLVRLFVLAFSLSLAHIAFATTIEAVTEDSSYTFVDHGRVSGPASEVVRDTLNKAGLLDVHFGLYPWARAYSLALAEPNVLIYPIARTPEREELFKWVGRLARVTIHLYKFRSDHEIRASSIEEARQYVVGAVRSDARSDYLAKHGFSKLVLSATNDQNFHLFQLREVEMIALPESEAIGFCKKADIPFTDLEAVVPLNDLEIGVYMAYSLATPDATVLQTVRAFNAIEAAGGLHNMEAQ